MATPRAARPVLPLAFAALLLAGCGDPAAPADAFAPDVVIESGPPQALPEEGEKGARSGGERGHMAGVVVDQAIRPLEGAMVRLPSIDLEEPTDRDGAFAFVDLVPGSYAIQVELAGYHSAQSTVDVGEGDAFTRVKVILEAIPPPEPRHETVKFDGFSQLTNPTLVAVGGIDCSPCSFTLASDAAGRSSMVIEAVMSPNPVGSNAFRLELSSGLTIGIDLGGTHPNPMLVETREEHLLARRPFGFRIEPESTPAPEANKAFQVYVTSWYHSLPPPGWSYVAGDT